MPFELPDDVVAALRSGLTLTSSAPPGDVSLRRLADLELSEAHVCSDDSPIRRYDPNRKVDGFYVVPVVQLIAACTGDYCPDGVLVWLPDYLLFGQHDPDHLDLKVFKKADWKKIVADPDTYLGAQWSGSRVGSFLRPWDRCRFEPLDSHTGIDERDSALLSGDLSPEELEQLRLRVDGAMGCVNLDTAEPLAKRWVELCPNEDKAWRLHGEIQLKRKRLARAREAFARAAEIRPGNTLAQLYLCDLCKRTGQKDRAQMAYQACLAQGAGADLFKQLEHTRVFMSARGIERTKSVLGQHGLKALTHKDDLGFMIWTSKVRPAAPDRFEAQKPEQKARRRSVFDIPDVVDDPFGRKDSAARTRARLLETLKERMVERYGDTIPGDLKRVATELDASNTKTRQAVKELGYRWNGTDYVKPTAS